MPKLILDKFTTMPISRQRRYQMRKQQSGKCKICGQPAKGLRCKLHQAAAVAYMRARRSPAYDLI